MKLLLLLPVVFISIAGNAQGNTEDYLEKFRKNKWRVERPLVTVLPKDSSALKMYPFLKKAPGVYSLPQDGMPCIVPETKDVVSIPNVWKGSLRSRYKGRQPSIPNPSQPKIESETK